MTPVHRCSSQAKQTSGTPQAMAQVSHAIDYSSGTGPETNTSSSAQMKRATVPATTSDPSPTQPQTHGQVTKSGWGTNWSQDTPNRISELGRETSLIPGSHTSQKDKSRTYLVTSGLVPHHRLRPTPQYE